MKLLVPSVLMLLVVTSSMAASIHEKSFKNDYVQHLKDQFNGAYCPPLEPSIRYIVSVVDTVTPPVDGCAYIDYGTDRVRAVFHLWLGRPENGGSGICEDKENMDHYMFTCMGKRLPSRQQDISLGRWFVAVRRVNGNSSIEPENRCLVYEPCVCNPKVFQVVLSGYKWRAEGYDQCHGLLDRLDKPQLNIPDGQQSWADGSMVLFLRQPQPRFSKIRFSKFKP